MVELRKSILEQIKKDREHDIVDKILIKDAIQQFINMGFEQKTMI